MNRSFSPAKTRQAIRILTEAFQRFSGTEAHVLCQEIGVVVRYTLDDPDKAYLVSPHSRENRWVILLPEEKKSRHEESFLIFHEMAHLFLFATASILPFGTEEYWEMECWCDNFAILMLFASSGYEVASEEVGDYLGRADLSGMEDGVNRRAGEMIKEMLTYAPTLSDTACSGITELAEILLAREKRPA